MCLGLLQLSCRVWESLVCFLILYLLLSCLPLIFVSLSLSLFLAVSPSFSRVLDCVLSFGLAWDGLLISSYVQNNVLVICNCWHLHGKVWHGSTAHGSFYAAGGRNRLAISQQSRLSLSRHFEDSIIGRWRLLCYLRPLACLGGSSLEQLPTPWGADLRRGWGAELRKISPNSTIRRASLLLVAPYRAILRYYHCDTPYPAILFKRV